MKNLLTDGSFNDFRGDFLITSITDKFEELEKTGFTGAVGSYKHLQRTKTKKNVLKRPIALYFDGW